MKRITIALGCVLLLVLALVFSGTLPVRWMGGYSCTEICPDCGMTRGVEGYWAFSPAWNLSSEKAPPTATLVSLQLGAWGSASNPHHVWRPYSGQITYQGGNGAHPFGAGQKGKAHLVLPQELALGKLDPVLAMQVVRARLAREEYDQGEIPSWFQARGWPPPTAEEARGWWAANRPGPS